ncbi:transposase, partial [Sphingomonas sp. ZB1N12]|uniref:transposase n=1 Tax=Sphingomonas arabinosi TaxID=3096160 RepID=UPI002FC73EB7
GPLCVGMAARFTSERGPTLRWNAGPLRIGLPGPLRSEFAHAKTDAIDAAMLARMGALLTPPVRQITSEAIDDMRELHIARLALIKDRTAARNREHACRSPLLKRHAAQRLAQIDRQIAAIDAALNARLQTDPELVSRFEILISIPGVGALTAIIMLIEMPELGQLESKQVASLAGLAPQARDSGQYRGKRHIRGGRAVLRQALYMPALVATRFNVDLKAKYQAMVTAGKPPKVAITAIMRKLIILANTLLKADRKWIEKPA